MVEQNGNKTPPSGTRWIMAARDLPQDRRLTYFRVTKSDGREQVLALEKRKAQVLQAIMRSPIYCASPVRLSDIVHILKRDYDIGIITEFYSDDSGPEPTRFGVYFLTDQVVNLGPVLRQAEVAA